MNLGEKIYHFRIENNMSQGDLANALEVSRHQFPSGKQTPQFQKVMA